MLKKKLKRANDGLNATQKVYEGHCLYVGRRSGSTWEWKRRLRPNMGNP
jgi:hypothetical protein